MLRVRIRVVDTVILISSDILIVDKKKTGDLWKAEMDYPPYAPCNEAAEMQCLVHMYTFTLTVLSHYS